LWYIQKGGIIKAKPKGLLKQYSGRVEKTGNPKTDYHVWDIGGRRKTVKKILSGFAVTGCVFFAVGVVFPAVAFLVSGNYKPKEDVQMRTDTEPIYNHFPGLPETSEIQWCSRTSAGIGLTTLKLHIFSFYDHDISSALQDMEIENQSGDVEFDFVPDSINGNEKWRHVENANFAFQAGIKDTEKMYTTVYINEAGTILYIDAIGD